MTFGFVDCWSDDLLDQVPTVAKRYCQRKAYFLTITFFFTVLPPALSEVTLKR